ncbi:ribosomal L7Ae/L30e/S12e/Gadd45 family protein [candidate division KSB1 bacterium]|nr:ribosomal L7Ae/L30e/S12e/Gadd45 family protein [candidate division KSB1 bacterium]TDI90399.1 MAG: hypothetical protein E2O77_08320 [Caldithrix sp.]TDI93343.1 MAG: hypothetical protein E2O76_17465 [Caldithrix sp.]
MNEIDQTLKMLGFAHRARKLSLGMTSTLSLLKKGKTHAIILASDVSQNADRKFQTLAVQGRVPIFRCGTKSQFGRFFGREEVGIIGIGDAAFAKAIQKIFG